MSPQRPMPRPIEMTLAISVYAASSWSPANAYQGLSTGLQALGSGTLNPGVLSALIQPARVGPELLHHTRRRAFQSLIQCASQGQRAGALFHGAVVITDTLLSVKRYLTKAPRPMAAKVSGSHSSVMPRARLAARSPRCGGPSQCVTSGPQSR